MIIPYERAGIEFFSYLNTRNICISMKHMMTLFLTSLYYIKMKLKKEHRAEIVKLK